MLYFKNQSGAVFAFDTQAERVTFGAPDLVQMSNEQVQAHINPVVPPTVPQSVTRFQALAALHLAGHLPAVQAIMAAPETPVLTKLAWDNALSFERSSPTLAALASQLGLTSQDLDALFTTAAGIAA